jgi:hypothetical protein
VRVFSEGTGRAIEAMKGAGVSRLAVITGIGAGESRGHGGLLYEWIGLPFILGVIRWGRLPGHPRRANCGSGKLTRVGPIDITLPPRGRLQPVAGADCDSCG